MTIKLKGSTDGSVSIQAPADTSPTGNNMTLTLPTTLGSANEFVKMTDGSGTIGYSDMVETSTGIGIGTDAPKSKVHIVDSLGGGQLLVASAQSPQAIEKYGSFGTEHYNPSEEPALGFAVQSSSTANTVLIGGALGEFNAASYIRFYTGSGNSTTTGTQRMFINDVGHIFSGTDSNFPGSGNTNTGFMLEQASDGKTAFISRNNNITCYLNRNSDGTLVRFLRSGTEEGYINVTTTSASLVSTSDYRLKENAVSIADGITRVKQLQPKRFNFIADPSTTVDGFMAHEVQTVVPEAAFGEHDAVDAEGNPKYQGLDQSKLIPLLTAALQEAIAKIETLETKVAALEAGS